MKEAAEEGMEGKKELVIYLSDYSEWCIHSSCNKIL